MSSSDPAAPQPSLVRTGAKAGLSFAGSVIKGALLGVFLGGGVFFFYAPANSADMPPITSYAKVFPD